MYHTYHRHTFPCLRCHPHSYIRMVQHLIERCLILHMSRDQCIKALAEHASIRPLVTLTVWRELQKENRHFFQAYFRSISPAGPFTSTYAWYSKGDEINDKKNTIETEKNAWKMGILLHEEGEWKAILMMN